MQGETAETEDGVIHRQMKLASTFRDLMTKGQSFNGSNAYRENFYEKVIESADNVRISIAFPIFVTLLILKFVGGGQADQAAAKDVQVAGGDSQAIVEDSRAAGEDSQTATKKAPKKTETFIGRRRGTRKVCRPVQHS
jgi:hypothetical protein